MRFKIKAPSGGPTFQIINLPNVPWNYPTDFVDIPTISQQSATSDATPDMRVTFGTKKPSATNHVQVVITPTTTVASDLSGVTPDFDYNMTGLEGDHLDYINLQYAGGNFPNGSYKFWVRVINAAAVVLVDWMSYTFTIAAAAPSASKLLLVAGQSNAISYGATDTSGLGAINSSRVKIWNGTGWDGYVAGSTSEPTGAFPGRFGPEAQEAVRWLADNTNPAHILYIVKRPEGATSITQWLAGQTQFENMSAWVSAAKTAIADTSITANPDIIFAQGEEDSTATQTVADAYTAREMIWFAQARAQWGGSNSKVAIVRVDDDATNQPHYATIQAAQNYVAQLYADARLVNMNDGTIIDPPHYNSASIITMGDRCYDALVNGSSVETPVTTFAGARLNPSDKMAACTLLNENLTAAAQVNTGLAQVRSTVAIPSGSKRRFSVRIDRSLGSAAGIGLATGSYTLGSGDFFGAGSDALALLIGLQAVYSSGATVGGTLTGSTVATNKVFDWAVDSTANKFWLRVDGGAWLGGGDPDAGTGGLSIPASLQGVALYVVLSPAGGGTLATEGMLTLNTGRDPYTYAMPTTFSDIT